MLVSQTQCTLITDSEGISVSSKLTEKTTGVTAEVNSDLGDIMIRGFWERNNYCIVDVRIWTLTNHPTKTEHPKVF